MVDENLIVPKHRKEDNQNETHHDAITPDREQSDQSFKEYLQSKRNPIKLAILSFFLGTVLIGTLVVLGQEALKRSLLREETKARIDLLNSSVGFFPYQERYSVDQLLDYELSVSDFIENIEISVIFGENTEILNYNVLYSLDISGFKVNRSNKNHIIVTLHHPLDIKRRVRIFLSSRRIVVEDDKIELEFPEISLEGKDKNGKKVYLNANI